MTTRRPVRPDRKAGASHLRTVAFVGIDGAGKTIQARHLAEVLRAGGVPAVYWQNAGGRRWLGRLAERLGFADAERMLGRGGMLLAESVLRWLALARAFVRSAMSRRVAVMDRDAVCQYASIRAHARPGWERWVRFAYRLFPRPDVTFFLSVAPAEAHRRVEARGTDRESLDFLAAAERAYRSLPEYPTLVVIDADGTPNEVAEAIVGHLRPWFTRRG